MAWGEMGGDRRWPSLRLSGALYPLLGLALLLLTPPLRALDLAAAHQRALQHDATWLAAQAAAVASREGVVQARSQLRPTIGLSGAWNRVMLDERVAGVERDRRYYDSSNLTLSLRQSLWHKPRQAQLAQAEAQQLGVDAELRRAAADLLQRLARAWFDRLYAEDLLTEQLAEQSAVAEQLAVAAAAFAAGEGTRTDIDEAQAQRDLLQARELQLRQQVRYAGEQLASMLALPESALGSLAGLLSQPPAATVEGAPLAHWLERAEAASPELAVMASRIAAAEQALAMARGQRHPTLDLVLQHSRSSSEYTQSPDAAYETSQVGLQFSWPIYQGGRLASGERQAVATLQQLREQQTQLQRDLMLRLRKAYQSVNEGAARIAALDQAVRSAAQLVISTGRGIAAGTRTRLDQLQAQQREAAARRERALAWYQYLLARLQLTLLGGETAEVGIAAVVGWLEPS